MIVLAMSAFLVGGATPMPTATPTVYAPTFTETLHRTLSSGAYGEPAGTSATGEAVDGFALSLTANRYRFRMGESLWFAVELRNVSGTSKSTSFSWKNASYSFIISDVKTGMETFREATPNFGPPASYKFPPKTSLFLWFLPELTNHVEGPGQYTIQAQVTVGGSTLRSNVVMLNILSSSDARPSFAVSDPSDKTPSGPVVSGAAVAISKYTPL